MKRVWIAVALLFSSCATQTGSFTERDRVVLEGRIADLETAQSRQKVKFASLETRLVQLEDKLAMMSRRTTLDAREVVRIEPDSGLSTHYEARPTPHDDVQDDVYEEIVISEEKKRAYFGRASSNASSAQAPSRPLKPYDNITDEKLPTKAENTAQTSAASAPISPVVLYQEGIDLYRQGNFADARAKFETFLAAKPETSYIDNALYWIGECYYGEGLFHEAAGYFHRIVQEYPKENKVPDALLKVSLTYQKLGKMDSAREMLRYLMEAFPGTEAARIGKEKYESMNAAP